jgi:hypothetical protein
LLARLDERQLAEEVVQDVMLAAWRSAGRFRGESKVLTWLLTIGGACKGCQGKGRQKTSNVVGKSLNEPPPQ